MLYAYCDTAKATLASADRLQFIHARDMIQWGASMQAILDDSDRRPLMQPGVRAPVWSRLFLRRKVKLIVRRMIWVVRSNPVGVVMIETEGADLVCGAIGMKMALHTCS